MRILREDSMAVVVDMQERMMPVIHEKAEIIDHTIILLKGLEVLDIPVMMSRQYPKGLGETIAPILRITKGYPVLDKIEFSCYDNLEMKHFIQASGKKNIILCGAETHVCVLQTALDLIEDGFRPILVADCIGSRTLENKKIGLRRAIEAGAMLASYESILFELLRKAGTDTFKEISKLVK